MITKLDKTNETAKNIKKPMDSIREAVNGKHTRHAQEEKDSVLEIISDLEKQLEVAFGIKDVQENEIQRLKTALEKAEKRIALGEAKDKETQALLVSQEKMNFNLEFLENERLQTIEKIRELEENLQNKAKEQDESAKRIELLIRDVKSREARIDQMEAELNSANSTIQNFQDRIYATEEAKDELRKKLKEAEEQVALATEEKIKAQSDLEEATESLAEIRTMLSDTRAKAKGHYYKK
ncbi:MAG: hypothetical protein HQL15_02930 [Candidatus Omnitrophica bacterium]|nr:hypothetical protein [Candidatus Omnitrophota bacterium]